MRPSNNPDIAVVQEWIGQVEDWIQAHGLKGYDPFDVKQHPFIRAAQPHPVRRKITTGLCDVFPHRMRAWLGVEETENPKTYALVALGDMRMYQLTDSAEYLDRALERLRWLTEHRCDGYAGACWGYPFDVSAKGLETPRNTPVGVVSAIAGLAYLRAHELTQEQSYLDTARSIADFILRDLPRIEQDDGTVCFGYTPTDRRRVHNANLLAVEHLVRLWNVTGEEHLLEAAEPALRFTLARQREDGAWTYGEYAPGEPFEPGLLRMVDHHHTGFVLRSLHAIQALRPDPGVRAALRKGFRYYRTLLTPGGMPFHEYGKYPVDIHACTEAILCLSVLSETLFGAKDLAIWAMRWAHYYMRNPENGAPYYRKYPFFTSRIVFPRWGVAWLYWALAEYLFRFYSAQRMQ